MKKIITSIAISAISILFMTSCKKTDKPQEQTTIQKIQGTWFLQNIVDNYHSSGVDHIYTTSGISTDFFEFRNDGKIYYSVTGYRDTIPYTLIGDTKIIIGGTDSYDIKTLNANSFIMYKKEMTGGSDYDEETINLKK